MQNADLLTQAEVADILRISERTLERHRLTGRFIPYVKLGRRVVYRRADVDAWIQANTFTSTSAASHAATP